MSVDNSPAWEALKTACGNQDRAHHLGDLFRADPDRATRFSVGIDGLYLDYSKNRLDDDVLQLLLKLADQQQLPHWIARMLNGERVNTTEDRAALHTALRRNKSPEHPEVETVLEQMSLTVNKIRSGQWRGFSGKPVTDVVNIGVGGSDLGPHMVCHALKDGRIPVAVHFISSIDGTQLSALLASLNPETTLFVVASKSFTTIDTVSNAETSRRWLSHSAGDDSLVMNHHFIGISSSSSAMTTWGIPASNQLNFWDWVGGRYSLWSAIGLVIAVALGMSRFRELLAGAATMDNHFASAPLAKNMPVIMGLIDVWNINFLGINAKSILPYDARLKYLPAYLEQLVMESNGKSVSRDGEKLEYNTCPIVWGEVGPNAQHAFYQLLHQGTRPVSCDFILPIGRDEYTGRGKAFATDMRYQQRLSIANCLAQSRVLMLGDAAIPPELKDNFSGAHRHYPGNQPSNTLLLDELSAHTLGMLIALYEHKTFVEAVIWEINPFDQWGVELGKLIATEMYQELDGDHNAELDSSTINLLKRVKQ